MPQAFYHDASLHDLADAYEGYMESKGLLAAIPRISRRFLDEMTQKYPDQENMK